MKWKSFSCIIHFTRFTSRFFRSKYSFAIWFRYLRLRIVDPLSTSHPFPPAAGGERRGDARQVGARGVPGAGRAVGHAVRGAGAAPRRARRAASAPRAARARALRLRPRGRRVHTVSGARSVMLIGICLLLTNILYDDK